MRKEKLTIIITISIMSFILVCVMFAQFRVVNETDIAKIETMGETELEKAIGDWKEKYEKTIDKLEETNSKITEYKDKIQSNEESSELIEKELEQAKETFGLTDVSGDGLIITLTDNDEKSYTAKDLVELVNELREAGAKAISINGERITNITYIVDISTRYIKINNTTISSPYEVKVIGTKTYLKSALTIKNGYYDFKQKEKYNIDIQEKNNIKIEKYNEDVKLKYIEL